MKFEEEIPLPVREYQKTAISICELNQTFQQMENQLQMYDSSKAQYNRIDKEFRSYVQQFTIIKKKDNNGINIINRRFRELIDRYEQQLMSQQVDGKEYTRLMKKFKRTQIKAWNLNLDKVDDIKVVCNAFEFPEEYLMAIALIIKNDNHD